MPRAGSGKKAVEADKSVDSAPEEEMEYDTGNESDPDDNPGDGSIPEVDKEKQTVKKSRELKELDDVDASDESDAEASVSNESNKSSDLEMPSEVAKNKGKASKKSAISKSAVNSISTAAVKSKKPLPVSNETFIVQVKPKYSDMLLEVFKENEIPKGGLSYSAIKNLLHEKYDLHTQRSSLHIKKNLEQAVAIGVLIRVTGVGANGSFKLAKTVPPPKAKIQEAPTKVAKDGKPENSSTKKTFKKVTKDSPRKNNQQTKSKKTPEKSKNTLQSSTAKSTSRDSKKLPEKSPNTQTQKKTQVKIKKVSGSDISEKLNLKPLAKSGTSKSTSLKENVDKSKTTARRKSPVSRSKSPASRSLSPAAKASASAKTKGTAAAKKTRK